jgi:hypothetical protein
MSLGTAHPHISGLNGLDGPDGLRVGLNGRALCLHHAHAMFIFFENEKELIVGSQ